MSGFAFRSATFQDGVDLLAVHLAAIMATTTKVYPKEILESWAFGLSPDGYARSMNEGEEIEVAVAGDGRIIAFCGVRNGEVFGLFIHPEFQGMGLGSKLLMRGEERAKKQMSEAKALPLSATLSTVGFYEKHGYVFREYKTLKSRGGLMMKVAQMEKHRT